MPHDSPLLPHEPPPVILRAIAWLLCAVALVVAVVSVTVQFPEMVRCPFVLVSETGDEPLLSPVQAVLVEVHTQEGASVTRDATLFVLRSDEIRNWHTQRSTLREELRALEGRRTRLDELQATQLSIKEAQIVQVQQEMEFRQKHVGTSREFLASMESLDQRGGATKVDMLNHRLALASAEKDLLLAQKSLLQNSLELEQLKIERARQRTDEQAEVEKLRIRIAALEQQLENCDGDRMYIRAPYDAVVMALDRRSGGNLIQAGQSLVQLARQVERPHARLQLEEAALARLRPGQRARFFFEAYPYQRHGTVTGRIDWITPAPVSSRTSSQFIAAASLDSQFNAAGAPRPLRVGMKGEARILVGSRTLAEHVAEPMRQVRENLRP